MGPPIPLYEPLESGQNDKIFISKSYDATSHFETTTGMFWFLIIFFFPHIAFYSSSVDEWNKYPCWHITHQKPDDIRDIYQRATGEELVVEGLREGQSLVGEDQQ